MILRDRISIVESSVDKFGGSVIADHEVARRWDDVPAQVDHRESELAIDAGQGTGWYQRQSLVVIINPRDTLLTNRRHGIEWRGKRYAIVNPEPVVTRRGTRDHHWTLELQRRGS